jgi:hypothetical protein
MTRAQTINALNRLLTIEHRSFPTYMMYADPWTHLGDEGAMQSLANIAADQQEMSRRIAELIVDLGGRIEPGEYPMEFTDTHFLSLEFLVSELLGYQKQTITQVEELARQLSGEPQAQELAEEVLGSERAHLEMIESLARQPA